MLQPWFPVAYRLVLPSQAILTELGLPITGVKADLTARILEHQEKQSGSAETGAQAPETSATPSAPAAASAESGDASSKQENPATAEAAPAAQKVPEAPAEKLKDAPALPEATDKSSEAEKRAARLKRFGAPAEELAKQERAARFGEPGADAIDDKVRSIVGSLCVG